VETNVHVDYNRVNTHGLWLWLWLSAVVLGDSLFYWHNRPWYVLVEVYPYITAVFAGSLLTPFVKTVNPKWSFWLFVFFLGLGGFLYSPVSFVFFVIGFLFFTYCEGSHLYLPTVAVIGAFFLWLVGVSPLTFLMIALMVVFSLYYHPILADYPLYRDIRLIFLISWVTFSLMAMVYIGLDVTPDDAIGVIQGVLVATGWFFLDRWLTSKRPVQLSLRWVLFLFIIVACLLHDPPRHIPVDQLFESGWLFYDK